MSSPERDKHLAALASLEAFCEAQYNDVPDIDVDCVDYDSQEIPF